ncbi:hypothetical protein B0H13DRAFT_1886842 [Mycena leptocephala]|nr:hypothetical protein B0H13DRAFT_1886842 [Mycena leptocephala]
MTIADINERYSKVTCQEVKAVINNTTRTATNLDPGRPGSAMVGTPPSAKIGEVSNSLETQFDMWNISLGPFGTAGVFTDIGPDTLSVMQLEDSWVQLGPLNNSIVLYTSSHITDSLGHTGSYLDLTLPKNNTVLHLQFLRCSKSLVYQSASVDGQSHKLENSSVYPNIYKTHSIWRPAAEMDFSDNDSTLIGSDLWSDILMNDEIHGPGTDGYDNHNSYSGGGSNISGQGVTSNQTNSKLEIAYSLHCWEKQHPVESMGLLHSIWLYRDQPGHLGLWNNIQYPTENELRRAGLVKIQLSNAGEIRIKPRGDLCPYLLSPALSTDSFVAEAHSSAKNYLARIRITLHILLVLIHLTLLGISLSETEHTVVFSARLQGAVSFWGKVATTAVGTRVAISHAIQTYSTVTSTHDRLSAWAGIGSSLSTLSNQLAVPASVFGTLSIFGYLSAISILHVTTPSLFSAEIFNLSISTIAVTRSIPQWNGSDHNATIQYIEDISSFLPYFGNLEQSQTVGLFNGSLYDVLTETYPGNMTAEVEAFGFNITCLRMVGLSRFGSRCPPIVCAEPISGLTKGSVHTHSETQHILTRGTTFRGISLRKGNNYTVDAQEIPVIVGDIISLVREIDYEGSRHSRNRPNRWGLGKVLDLLHLQLLSD